MNNYHGTISGIPYTCYKLNRNLYKEIWCKIKITLARTKSDTNKNNTFYMKGTRKSAFI